MRVVSAFWVSSRNPLTKLAEIRRKCGQNVCRQNPLRILIIPLIKKLYLFFAGISILFPSQTSQQTHVPKIWDPVLRSTCEETDAMLIVFFFFRPKLSGRTPWFMCSWSFLNTFTFSKHSKSLQIGSVCSYWAGRVRIVKWVLLIASFCDQSSLVSRKARMLLWILQELKEYARKTCGCYSLSPKCENKKVCTCPCMKEIEKHV